MSTAPEVSFGLPQIGEIVSVAKVAEVDGDLLRIAETEHKATIVGPEITGFNSNQLTQMGLLPVQVNNESPTQIVEVIREAQIKGEVSLIPSPKHGREIWPIDSVILGDTELLS